MLNFETAQLDDARSGQRGVGLHLQISHGTRRASDDTHAPQLEAARTALVVGHQPSSTRVVNLRSIVSGRQPCGQRNGSLYTTNISSIGIEVDGNLRLVSGSNTEVADIYLVFGYCHSAAHNYHGQHAQQRLE